MAYAALRFAKKQPLSTQLTVRRLMRIQVPRHVQLRRGRKIQHVLQLRHVRYLNSIEDVSALFKGMQLIAVEVSRSLLELGKVFDRSQTSLRAMDLLIEDSAQADGV